MSKVSSAARPTLRCLREDLLDDWDDAGHARSVRQGDLDATPPFPLLNHPVVRHLTATFSGGDGDVLRESISGLTDPMWWKLKTSRWRGAVYVDDDGQAWLCAAGLRREREATDFYKAFSAAIKAGGPARFLPNDEDRRRLKRELVDQALSEWERAVHEATISAFLAAEGAPISVDVPGLMPGDGLLARVEVSVVRLVDEDDGDSIGEVVLDVEPLDYTLFSLVERAEIVMMAAISPDEQAWAPGFAGSRRMYSLCGTAHEVERLRSDAQVADRAPGAVRPGTVAHFAHKLRLTEHYVEGTATRALCGVYFVPRQAPDGLEQCPACAAVFRMLGA